MELACDSNGLLKSWEVTEEKTKPNAPEGPGVGSWLCCVSPDKSQHLLEPFLICKLKVLSPALPTLQDCCTVHVNNVCQTFCTLKGKADIRHFEILVYGKKFK